MRRYLDKEIEKVKNLRKKEKYSFAQLQKATGIPATTIRNWCQDEILGTRWDTLLISNERKRQELRESETRILSSIKALDKNQAKIFLSLFYWCEGSKYPSHNGVAFSNSDPNLLKTFIKLMRQSFSLDEKKFRIHLQIHDTHDFAALRNYWSNLLNIAGLQFLKPTVTKRRGTKHRKEYLGTCTIKYQDYRIQLKLMGLYEAFHKKFAKD